MKIGSRQLATGNSRIAKLFGFSLCAVLVALSLSVEARQAQKTARIGYLSTLDAVRDSARTETIRLSLRELGYTEGHNIAFEYRYAEGKLDRYAELAAELVRLKVDVIVVAGGTVMIREAQKATKTIPIVMAGAPPDPVNAGLVESLARPGGNVTGITILSRDLSAKRLELFKEAVPTISRVAVVYAPASAGAAREVKEVLPAAARALGVTIRSWQIRAAEDLEKVFAELNKQRPNGLYLSPDVLLRVSEKRTIGFALERRLPSMYSNREAVDAGGLMYYGADAADNYRRIALYVDRILNGTKPAEFPVEQPTKFELVIYLKTADQIGLTISQRALSRADKVIK